MTDQYFLYKVFEKIKINIIILKINMKIKNVILCHAQ